MQLLSSQIRNCFISQLVMLIPMFLVNLESDTANIRCLAQLQIRGEKKCYSDLAEFDSVDRVIWGRSEVIWESRTTVSQIRLNSISQNLNLKSDSLGSNRVHDI